LESVRLVPDASTTLRTSVTYGISELMPSCKPPFTSSASLRGERR